MQCEARRGGEHNGEPNLRKKLGGRGGAEEVNNTFTRTGHPFTAEFQMPASRSRHQPRSFQFRYNFASVISRPGPPSAPDLAADAPVSIQPDSVSSLQNHHLSILV